MMSWAGKAIIYRFPSIFFRRIFFSLSFISFVDDSTRSLADDVWMCMDGYMRDEHMSGAGIVKQ